MLDTQAFGRELKKHGFQFYSGVPCSFLKDLINCVINHYEYIMATNEGDAVAICSGAYLGGRKAVFLCQNSGLTNAVSPLTSLNYIFKIPILGFVSLRGETGIPDEPQHELMGTITTSILEMMQIKWEYLSGDLDEAIFQINKADEYIEKNQSFFFVVKKDTFTEERLLSQITETGVNRLKEAKSRQDQYPGRIETLEKISFLKETDTVIFATTGKTGRELYEIEDAPNNLYMVGSMGCVSSLALGLALARNDKKVIAVDGDGAVLMRMGAMATNAYYRPSNMCHIVLDNNTYDSTGGQLTVSDQVNFVDLAAAVGYPRSIYIHNLTELESEIKKWRIQQELTFLYLKIAKGSKEKLGRPKIKPHEVKERLMQFINS